MKFASFCRPTCGVCLRFDERLHRYRLAQPKLDKSMAQSLERYGQVSPVVICVHEEEHVLIDGFKRLSAARTLKGMTSLTARRIDVDEQGAKAAVYNLNCIGQRPKDLEESWVVHSLVREDGLSQVEAAQLLGRHKSWVNRRLAMLERPCDAAREELRLGLLTPAQARQLTRFGHRRFGGRAATKPRPCTRRAKRRSPQGSFRAWSTCCWPVVRKNKRLSS